MNPYSPEALTTLRALFENYRRLSGTTWKELVKTTGISKDRLQKFPTQNQPSSETMTAIYALLRSAAFEDRRVLDPEPKLGAALLDIPPEDEIAPPDDDYATFKARAKLAEDTQARLSRQLLGTYLTLRCQRKGGVFLSHIRFFNSYSTVGLPTFTISRMRRDEDGIDEGNFVVDGAAFSKNGKLTLVGYDLDIGNMRCLFLQPMDGDARAYKGVVSGYDTVGPPTFSSKVFVERIPDNRRYDDLREHTGFFDDMEAAAAAIETVVGPDNSLQKRLSTLAANGYLGVSATG